MFLRIHHDNSHPLNTLYLYFVSGSRDWATYRLFSLLCGLLSVAVLARDREEGRGGLFAAGLAAVSAPMVLYATEARGYAASGLFALLCFRLFDAPRGASPARRAAFGVCAVLGFLSHLTFVYVFAALGLWSLHRAPAPLRAREAASWFAGPALAVGAIEAVVAHGMVVGGANVVPFWKVLPRTLVLWSGAPDFGLPAAAGVTAFIALLAWEWRRLRAERPHEAMFFAALFAGGAACAAAMPFPAERYLFVCLPFALLLAGRALARLSARGGAPRIAVAALALAFLCGNAVRVRGLATAGRGHYLEAVQRMAAETPDGPVSVGSDHRFRNETLLRFYETYVSPPRTFEYLPEELWPARGAPQWYLRHATDADVRAEPAGLSFADGSRYALVETYPYSGLSGWTWLLYRRDAAPRPQI